LKWAVMAVALVIYYVTPWLRWNRGPYAPDQAVLIDLAHRRFYMFSIEIWPHEFYYVAGLLIMAAIGLFLVTSAVGRAWCGYACPQTVWTDLFVHVERMIEGDRNAQIRLDRAPWGPAKIAKRTSKIVLWLAIAVSTAYPHPRTPRRHRAVRRLCDDRGPDLHHLHAGWPDARAGMHLYVSVAAYPGRDDGRAHARGDLQELARRTA
jgi:hypothetical protein